MWIEILRKEVEAKGAKQVAKELGVSRTTVDLVCQGKYPADTKRVESKIAAIYGQNGEVVCPVLGAISPNKCAEIWLKAGKIGIRAGNPETVKLYKTCLKCALRR